ncbi:MAG: 23S rRNA (uracil1939-C5)-methyltransferase [Flavobacteriales bacterium]|jgi:23S rRNA (uracil1939-C5)-methyltransferase|tara:strand:- start:6894 stop:8300 length:1407 start_codon:yes stop_codon:yes gene_type:complete
MGRRRKQLPVFENVTIIDAGAEGKAVAKVDEAVVFVTGVVPGDIVDLQVTKKRRRFYEAKPIKFHEYSKDRTEALCAHFGVCGGCKWQELPYDKQLFYKQKQVNDNFQRLGKFEFPEVMPILGSEKTEFYRNKMEYTFSHAEWLTSEQLSTDIEKKPAVGLHVPGRFDGIINIDKCFLQGSISNDVRNKLRTFALEKEIPFFNMRTQEGILRNLVIRTASTGEDMVIVIFFENNQEIIKDVMEFLKNEFPLITSLMYIVNEKKNDSFGDQEVILYSGKDHIYEEMEGLKFKIDPKSFYQTNSLQAYELYKVTRDFAGIKDTDIVYDLYTGTGTIANFVAKQAGKVIGVEYVPEAIKDAKINSETNNINNTTFFAGDMKDILTNDFVNKNGKPDVIITDPPRAGMHEDVINVLLNSAPEKIVYVSCNPATQARDIHLLDGDYAVEKVQPVDMFPHTHHVENVVLLKRKK